MARQNLLWAIIGTNRTGKTSEAINLARSWRQGRPYGRVVAYDPQWKFRAAKVCDFFIEEDNENWAEILIQEKKDKNGNVEKDKNGKPLFKFQNTLLIIDDYKSLLTANTMPKAFLKLLALRMEMGMDIIYITHNPKLILERLSYYTNHFSIFYTEASASDFSDKVVNYTLCQRASNVINKYVFAFGRGRYKDQWNPVDRAWNKGNVISEFPHAYVQTEYNEIELINVDPNKMALLEKNGMDEIQTKLDFKKNFLVDYKRSFPQEYPNEVIN